MELILGLILIIVTVAWLQTEKYLNNDDELDLHLGRKWNNDN